MVALMWCQSVRIKLSTISGMPIGAKIGVMVKIQPIRGHRPHAEVEIKDCAAA